MKKIFVLVNIIFISVILIFICDYFYSKFFLKQKLRISHEIFHHTLADSFEGQQIWGNKLYKVCTDKSGFKSSCNDISSYEKNFDIAFIGDSFTEAVGMTYENSFVGMIANNYSQLKIVNLAVSSYSPSIYYSKIKWLLDEGYTFKHIYVFVDISDIQDESIYIRNEKDIVTKMKFINEKKSFALKKFLKENLKLSYNLYTNIKYYFFTPKIDVAKSWVFTWNRSKWTSNFELTGYGDLGVKKSIDKALNEMNQLYNLLKLNNINLSIAVYPWPSQLVEIKNNLDGVNLQTKIWKDFCIDKCKNFIDIFDNYRNLLRDSKVEEVYKRYFIDQDIHFNQQGNDLIFKVLRKKI